VRSVAINYTGGHTTKWVVDRDCVLLGGQASAGNALVSENPASVTTDVSAPAIDGPRFDWYLWISGGATAGNQVNFQLKIPLAKDRAIYVATSSQGTVFLFLEDSAETIAT